MIWRANLLGVVAAAAMVLLPSLGWAAGGAVAHHGPPTAAQWKLLAFTIFNFALFAVLIYRFARNPLRDFLVERRRTLVAEIEEAARLKADAEAMKREYEQKLAALDRMRAELVEEIRTMAEGDRERLLAAASEAAERMRRDAERTAQSDLERARRELRAEAARLAEALAREELVRRLGDDDRRRLLHEFLQRVSS